MNKKWTEDELALLDNVNLTAEEISQRCAYRHSAQSVTKQRQRKGIRAKRGRPKRPIHVRAKVGPSIFDEVQTEGLV